MHNIGLLFLAAQCNKVCCPCQSMVLQPSLPRRCCSSIVSTACLTFSGRLAVSASSSARAPPSDDARSPSRGDDQETEDGKRDLAERASEIDERDLTERASEVGRKSAVCAAGERRPAPPEEGGSSPWSRTHCRTLRCSFVCNHGISSSSSCTTWWWSCVPSYTSTSASKTVGGRPEIKEPMSFGLLSSASSESRKLRILSTCVRTRSWSQFGRPRPSMTMSGWFALARKYSDSNSISAAFNSLTIVDNFPLTASCPLATSSASSEPRWPRRRTRS
mmetsp:Transcript_142939/g.372332  ORF Transcript_142939/g.372332 Transcript_142939/m.372332 type:complete len:276 (+) Transcript_142939:172-999(+)